MATDGSHRSASVTTRAIHPTKLFGNDRARGRSSAQKISNLFEEPLRSRLMLQEEMVLTLKCDEPGAGNAGSQLAAGLERHSRVPPHMHHQGRRGHFAEKLGDIEIARRIEVAGGALRGCGPALELVEVIHLFRCPPGDELRREHLPERRIIRAPSLTDQG